MTKFLLHISYPYKNICKQRKMQKSENFYDNVYNRIAGGLNNLPYLLSISVSMAVKKDILTIYMKALGQKQATMWLKIT